VIVAVPGDGACSLAACGRRRRERMAALLFALETKHAPVYRQSVGHARNALDPGFARSLGWRGGLLPYCVLSSPSGEDGAVGSVAVRDGDEAWACRWAQAGVLSQSVGHRRIAFGFGCDCRRAG
jgi:hypothetical protein